jgi:hypothetical protein
MGRITRHAQAQLQIWKVQMTFSVMGLLIGLDPLIPENQLFAFVR